MPISIPWEKIRQLPIWGIETRGEGGRHGTIVQADRRLRTVVRQSVSQSASSAGRPAGRPGPPWLGLFTRAYHHRQYTAHMCLGVRGPASRYPVLRSVASRVAPETQSSYIFSYQNASRHRTSINTTKSPTRLHIPHPHAHPNHDTTDHPRHPARSNPPPPSTLLLSIQWHACRCRPSRCLRCRGVPQPATRARPWPHTHCLSLTSCAPPSMAARRLPQSCSLLRARHLGSLHCGLDT